MTDKIEGVCVDKWMAMAGGLLLFAAAYMVVFMNKPAVLLPIYFLYAAVTLAFELFRAKSHPIMNLSAIFLGHLYVAIPFVLFCFVEGANDVSKYIMLAFFVMIWCSDTGAYLVGRFFGKHKMFERISPKKTWEGFFGGLLFAMVAGYVFHRLALIPSLEVSFWIGMAVGVFVFGVLGDLVESMFKRSVNLKDSGNMIPGHGGFLDRFDSALLASPFLFVYVLFFLVKKLLCLLSTKNFQKKNFMTLLQQILNI